MSALSLSEAAKELGWSRRSLVRKLEEHRIPTFGSGRLERIEVSDLELLKAKERKCRDECPTGSSSQESAPSSTSGGRSIVSALKSQRARQIAAALRRGQRNTTQPSSVIGFPTPGSR
ncbi:MAG: helix-turn-helix domain-containing protein [Proteobacteria bacterium]|nr:helix-turn-helix domain-containing protein [Pseudomonadota bacterium]